MAEIYTGRMDGDTPIIHFNTQGSRTHQWPPGSFDPHQIEEVARMMNQAFWEGYRSGYSIAQQQPPPLKAWD